MELGVQGKNLEHSIRPLVTLALLLAVILFAPAKASVVSQAPSSSIELQAPTSVGTGQVSAVYTVGLSSNLGFLNSLSHSESLNVTVVLPQNQPNATIRSISIDFIAETLGVPEVSPGVNSASLSNRTLPTFVAVSGVGDVHSFQFTFPNQAGVYHVNITGTLLEYSVLSEGGAEIPYQSVTNSFGSPVTPYLLLVRIPPGLNLRTSYSFERGLSFVSPVQYDLIQVGGNRYLSSNFFETPKPAILNDVVILLYSSAEVYLYAGGIALLLLIVLVAPLWFQPLRRFSPTIKRFLRAIQSVKTNQLLALFLLGCLLVVGLSFVFGPDPSHKVYVIGTDSQTSAVVGNITASSTLKPITLAQARENSVTISSLGTFTAIVVVDPTPSTSLDIIPYATGDITLTLASNTHIIILRGPASDSFIQAAQQLYGTNVYVSNTPKDVVTHLKTIEPRHNPLGLDISPSIFRASEQVVALLSFLLAFLAMAFVSTKIAEIGSEGKVVGVAEALGYAFFAFMFLQMVYITSSVFLGDPLGLHAGNPQITAAGTLGLAGGGSRPRELAGILGFAFGALNSTKLGTKVDRLAIIMILGLALLLVLDPLTGGVAFHEIILALAAGPSQGQGAVSVNFLGALLGNIAASFGSFASQWYFVQRGLILYFAGVVTFVLYPKLQRTTGTFLLAFSIFLAGDGIVRVADMIPLKVMASTIPGFMAALAVIPIFYLVSLFEKYIRTRFVRGP